MRKKPCFPHELTLFSGRLMWLIQIRWVALISALCLAFLLSYLEIIAHLNPIIVTLVVLGILNLVFFLLLKHEFWVEHTGIKGICFFQILCDILGVLTLVHFTGGLMNPFIFFLVAPVVVAGIYFQPRWTYLLAGLSLVLSFMLGYAEWHEWIPHHEIPLFNRPLEADAILARMTSLLIALGGLLFTGAYLACQIVSVLRKREWHLSRLKLQMKDEEEAGSRGKGDRLAALQELANGFEREVDAPLGIIKARVDAVRYAVEDLDQNPALSNGQEREVIFNDLDVISGKVDQINRTLGKVSLFLGRSLSEWNGVDPAYLLQILAYDLSDLLSRKGIALDLRISEDLPAMDGSAQELKLLFSSILNNALEAVEDQDEGRISIHARPLKGKKDLLLVRIRDTGPGIPPSVQKHVFDPFYSTRGEDRGMGLAIAYTIVRNHGGELRLRSRPPPGTSVLVLLPVKQPQQSPPMEKGVLESRRGGAFTPSCIERSENPPSTL